MLDDLDTSRRPLSGQRPALVLIRAGQIIYLATALVLRPFGVRIPQIRQYHLVVDRVDPKYRFEGVQSAS